MGWLERLLGYLWEGLGSWEVLLELRASGSHCVGGAGCDRDLSGGMSQWGWAKNRKACYKTEKQITKIFKPRTFRKAYLATS